MRLWQEFTTSLNTDALRRQTAFLAREEFLVGAFIIFLTTKVRPKDPARSFAKPSTYLGYVFAVRREHALLHLPFASNFVVNKVVDSLKKQYIALHGPEGLMPKRREPFSGDMVDRMLGAPNGLKFGSRSNPLLRWDSWLGINLAAAIAVSRAGGFRLAEIALAPDENFDASRMSRASLFFILGGTLLRHPSAEQLHAASDGDQAGLLVGVAKNDQFVEHFGPHPLFFTLNMRNPNCPARRLITLELSCPIVASSRRSTPLFSMTPSFEPMRQSFLRKALRALLLWFLSPEQADWYSWHSFRVGLACALLAAGAPDSIILALCRWRSTASLRIYARLNREVYGQWLDNADGQSLSSVQGANLPQLPGSLPIANITALDARSLVPGALSSQAYDLLNAVRDGECASLDRARLQLLASRIPEIDAHGFLSDMAELDIESIDPDEIDDNVYHAL
jgi:hypothetical protein